MFLKKNCDRTSIQVQGQYYKRERNYKVLDSEVIDRRKERHSLYRVQRDIGHKYIDILHNPWMKKQSVESNKIIHFPVKQTDIVHSLHIKPIQPVKQTDDQVELKSCARQAPVTCTTRQQAS